MVHTHKTKQEIRINNKFGEICPKMAIKLLCDSLLT